MSPEPWTLIVNSDDGTPKADDFGAGILDTTSDIDKKIHRQMYGMIWWMANDAGQNDRETAMSAIENARENYTMGVKMGKGDWYGSEILSSADKTMIDTSPASPEHPIYKKVKADSHGNFYMITCDEGWRTLIVCTDLYENVADWLLDILGRTPYAKKGS